MKSCAIKIFKPLFNQCFYSKFITHIIFNVNVYPYPHKNCQNWDFTTLILKKALDKFVKNNQNVLEIGTGHLAILSIYIAKKKNVNITAVEINNETIKNALTNAEKNDIKVNFKQSDLFSNVEGSFDIIFFNPPYVPTEWALKNNKHLYTNSIFDIIWNGGPDGCDTIKRFLNNVRDYTHEDSIILLGVNSLFVDPFKMNMLVQDAGLILSSTISSRVNPSKVYVIKKCMNFS